MPHPMRRPAATPPPGSTPALTINLKSLRNPPLSLALTSQSLSTTIYELKVEVAKHIAPNGGAIENVRILYKKKPCVDSKTVKEVIGDENIGRDVEFSVMVVGGAAKGDEPENAQTNKVPPVAQGPSGEEVTESEEFWDDLKGFLVQRIKDEGKAGELWARSREAWKKKG